MQAIFSGVAALSVTAIYYLWRAYLDVQARRRRTLRERVAFMLWIMADVE